MLNSRHDCCGRRYNLKSPSSHAELTAKSNLDEVELRILTRSFELLNQKAKHSVCCGALIEDDMQDETLQNFSCKCSPRVKTQARSRRNELTDFEMKTLNQLF